MMAQAEHIRADSRGMLDVVIDAPRARCYGCGWKGIPTYIKGKPSTECPECESKPATDRMWEEVLAEPKRRTYGQHFSSDEPGRNDPCPCGSGKKFKKCHGV